MISAPEWDRICLLSHLLESISWISLTSLTLHFVSFVDWTISGILSKNTPPLPFSRSYQGGVFLLGSGRSEILMSFPALYEPQNVKIFSRLRRDLYLDFAPQARKFWGFETLEHRFPSRKWAKRSENRKFFWPPKAAGPQNSPNPGSESSRFLTKGG